jgi:glycosyltransferase involved in cell wall biosynthesis
MKIIVICPRTTGTYKDDTEMFCEELSKKHEVVRIYAIWKKDTIISSTKITDNMLKDVDIIWAPYEPLIRVALELNTNCNTTVVGHYEMIPTTRVNLDNNQVWWTEQTDKYPVTDYFNEYKEWAEDWMKCQIKTTIGNFHKDRISLLLGRDVGAVHMKPYPFDIEMNEGYRDKSIEKKNQIVICNRLVIDKKVHHVIKALTYISNAPKLIVIGEGPEKLALEEYAKQLGVEVEFVGLVPDKEKARIIQESLLGIHLWAWLPIGETSFFEVPSITYDRPDTRERLSNVPIYTDRDDVKELAKTISHYLIHDYKRQAHGTAARKVLIDNWCNTKPVSKAVEMLEKIFGDSDNTRL